MSSGSLERMETCFARLYWNESEVYKVRKPVALRLGDEDIDLSSSEQRRAACLEEQRLNLRLAPDIALGVVPVSSGADGRPQFGAVEDNAPPATSASERDDAEHDDWALHMRRLPDAQRADQRLAEGTLSDDHLEALAERLATFHEQARREAQPARSDALETLRAQIGLRVEDVAGSAAATLPPEVEPIEAWQLDFLDANAERFRRRAKSDAIREGHGELALEHVFVDEAGEIRILAGLEMGPRVRQADVAADIALLATDLAVRHRVDLAERFVAEYARLANDFDLYPLLDFYSSLRAAHRGKLYAYCADCLASDAQRSSGYRERARRFFALALASPRRPMLPAAVVAMGGQVASGKSTVAKHIARRIGAPVVSSDKTREFLLGARLNEALHEVHWEDAYEDGFGTRVYDEVLRRAGEVLASGRPVVIDGCFRSPEQRASARALAQQFGRPFLFVEATISEDAQFERLSARAERDAVPIETWKDIADQLRAEWVPADELPADEHLSLDTALPLDRNAGSIEARLPTWPTDLTG